MDVMAYKLLLIHSSTTHLQLSPMQIDTNELIQLANDRADRDKVVLVFSDSRYREVLLNWLVGMHRLSIQNYLVISLDEEIHRYLEEHGFPTYLSPLQGDLSKLWIMRMQIFQALCSAGISFLHSDADAIWLKNPFPTFFDNSTHEIIASQGTIWPADVADNQGFVFCCGFFFVKSCQQTRELLDELAADVAVTGDDQVSLNRVLQEKSFHWDTEHTRSYFMHHEERRFTCYEAAITGQARNKQLSIALLPHHLFQRLHMPGQDAFLKHLLSDKDSESKLDMFQRTDCGFLAADWKERSFSAETLEKIDGNGEYTEEQFANFTDSALPALGDEQKTYWTPQEHLARYGPNFNSGMASYIARTIKPENTLEFGCGLGLYCHFLKTQLDIKKVFGIEPEPMGGVFDSPTGPTQLAINIFLDKHPEPLEQKFDLVMSIEVAEHIPREKHDFLFDFLVSHTSNWIVFSGARVGQGGHGHISERDEEDWKSEFLKRGMIFQDELTWNIRQACNEKNINHQQNLMVFKRPAGYEKLDSIENIARPYLKDILALVQQKCEFLDGNLFYVDLQDAINIMPVDSLKEKRRNLVSLIESRNNVLEIGFNAGHSALIMLLSNQDTRITVIDTCQHPYTEACFSYLDRNFPGRLKLIKGDSTKVIQELNGENFDLIHYDGGKEKTISEDLNNSVNLVEDDHILLIDDTQNSKLEEIVLGLEEEKIIELRKYHTLSRRTDKYKWRHVIATFLNSDQHVMTETVLQKLQNLYDHNAFPSIYTDSSNVKQITGLARANSLVDILRSVKHDGVQGDFIECGVAAGHSSVIAALALIDMNDEDTNLYLYDTYNGFSFPLFEDIDIDLNNKSIKEYDLSRYQSLHTSITCVFDKLVHTGLQPARIKMIKGVVEDTVPSYLPGNISVLRLDVDLYQPTLHCLRKMFPLLQKGGYLIIDDYGHWEGCKRAVHEFFEENGLSLDNLHYIDYTCRVYRKEI
jgi:predicted O-methyltransferase YrrM/2-polyprenyl-3-methyl-5-hydroxy-6-metoxy-1,4-benzoquinol methylase